MQYPTNKQPSRRPQALVAKDDDGAANGVYQSPYQSPFMTPNTRAKRDKERKAAERMGKKITKGNRAGSFA